MNNKNMKSEKHLMIINDGLISEGKIKHWIQEFTGVISRVYCTLIM